MKESGLTVVTKGSGLRVGVDLAEIAYITEFHGGVTISFKNLEKIEVLTSFDNLFKVWKYWRQCNS